MIERHLDNSGYCFHRRFNSHNILGDVTSDIFQDHLVEHVMDKGSKFNQF